MGFAKDVFLTGLKISHFQGFTVSWFDSNLDFATFLMENLTAVSQSHCLYLLWGYLLPFHVLQDQLAQYLCE